MPITVMIYYLIYIFVVLRASAKINVMTNILPNCTDIISIIINEYTLPNIVTDNTTIYINNVTYNINNNIMVIVILKTNTSIYPTIYLYIYIYLFIYIYIYIYI